MTGRAWPGRLARGGGLLRTLAGHPHPSKRRSHPVLPGLVSIIPGAALTLPTVPFGADAVRGPTWAGPEADPRAERTRTGPVTPGPAEAAAADEPSYYADGCHLPGPETVP